MQQASATATNIITIHELKSVMVAQQVALIDVRRERRGGFIPTSVHLLPPSEASVSFPPDITAPGIPCVFYEASGVAVAVSMAERLSRTTGLVSFVLEGGFRSYLSAVTDPATGEPYPGTVCDYDPAALNLPDEEAPPRVASSPALDELEHNAANADAPSRPPEAIDVKKFLGDDGKKSSSSTAHWTPDHLVDTCPFCERKFTTWLRKHHCRCCGQIYCFECSRFFILLKSQSGPGQQTQRVCRICVRAQSNLDYTSNITEFGAAGEGRQRVIVLNGELLTRKSLDDLGNALGSKQFCVVSADVPGFGSRDSQTLTEESFRNTLVELVDKYYKLDKKPVILFGISMSAYGILKTLKHIKPRKIFGVVLLNANKNMYQPSKLIMRSLGAVYSIFQSQSQLWKFVGAEQSALPQEKIETLFLRTPVDMQRWPDCVSLTCAPSVDFYPTAIAAFNGPILWLNCKKEGKSDGDLFSSKCVAGTTVELNGSKLAYCEPECVPAIVSAIEKWVDASKARVILFQELDSDEE